MFRVKASSLHLSKEFNNQFVFPHGPSKRFNFQHLDSRSRYEVHGDPIARNTSASPFGSYTGVSMPQTPRPLFSAGKRKKSTFRKTIVLVSLTNAASDRPSSSKSSNITYNVVTQVVVRLETDNCSPLLVAQLVEQQVGYSVILLDNKCFPILDNDTTRTNEYWKSTRKILAASKVVYVNLKGSSADPEKAKFDSIVKTAMCQQRERSSRYLPPTPGKIL